jgi:hypothetical protein
MDVVDREQERSASCEIRCQPVEAVERRERRVGPGLHNEQLGIEERLGQCGCPRQDVGALLRSDRGEEWLEELPHDAVRERPLELRAACSKHLHPRLLSECSRLGHQGGLADARRPFDRQHPSTRGCCRDQARDGRHLGVAFEQVELSRERLRNPLLVTGRHPVRLLGGVGPRRRFLAVTSPKTVVRISEWPRRAALSRASTIATWSRKEKARSSA